LTTLRIATRRSKLALAQAHWIKARLEALESGLTVELREYVTRGDQIQNVPLAQVGGKGLFTKEIEDALLAGEADLAVHSLKDLPSELPPGLALAAVPEREDPRDVLVLPAGSTAAPGCGTLSLLPNGTLVGSSSFRRSAQLRHARPDLRVESVRGNVDTRLRKLDEGQYGALVLAAAGLNRLSLSQRISAPLSIEESVPAPGQGALGLETRADDERTRTLLRRLEHGPTRTAIAAERAVMDAVGGGCSIPLGAHAWLEGDRLHLAALVASPDGARLVRETCSGGPTEPEGLGREVAERLLTAGARDLLAALR
jgi:hydroxymethylbilane synthase